MEAPGASYRQVRANWCYLPLQQLHLQLRLPLLQSRKAVPRSTCCCLSPAKPRAALNPMPLLLIIMKTIARFKILLSYYYSTTSRNHRELQLSPYRPFRSLARLCQVEALSSRNRPPTPTPPPPPKPITITTLTRPPPGSLLANLVAALVQVQAQTAQHHKRTQET